VNAVFSDAAAKTTIFADACEGWEGWEGDDEDDFEPHPTRPATSTVETKPARIPIRRMDEP
jgi:hypothetical protein